MLILTAHGLLDCRKNQKHCIILILIFIDKTLIINIGLLAVNSTMVCLLLIALILVIPNVQESGLQEYPSSRVEKFKNASQMDRRKLSFVSKTLAQLCLEEDFISFEDCICSTFVIVNLILYTYITSSYKLGDLQIWYTHTH